MSFLLSRLGRYIIARVIGGVMIALIGVLAAILLIDMVEQMRTVGTRVEISMLEALRLSREAAVRFLDTVPRARELYTIFFDEQIRLSRYDSEHQQGLFERIQEASGSGNTALRDAIAVYVSRVQGGAGRKVLVIFSDGEDTYSELSEPEILRLLRASDVAVYAIAFAGVEGRGQVRGLPGQFRAGIAMNLVTDFEKPELLEVPAVVAHILKDARHQRAAKQSLF